MVVVSCSVPLCEFKTEDVSEALAIALLTNHGLAHQNTPPVVAGPVPSAALRGPKLERPKVNVGISTEEWNVFIRRWEVFCNESGIDDASAPSQLFQCAGPELGDSILKANPNAPSNTLAELLAAMRSLAVIPVATGVIRTELLQLRQVRDEPFREFTARVRGKAETCAFTAKCECGKSVDYTNHAIIDVLLNGIYDTDIRREVLGTKDILKKPVNDVISLVENKEMAAMPSLHQLQRQCRHLNDNKALQQMLPWQPSPTRIGLRKLFAQTASNTSRLSQRGPGAGTPNHIKSVLTAIKLAAAIDDHVKANRPHNPPLTPPWRRTQYHRSQHSNPS